MRTFTHVTAVALVFCAGASASLAQSIVQQNDIAFGLSQGPSTTGTGTNATASAAQLRNTLQLIRPALTPAPAVGNQIADPWESAPGIQAVCFDNLGGIRKNPNGNLIAVDFGANPFPTTGTPAATGVGFRLYQIKLTTNTTVAMFNGFTNTVVTGTPTGPSDPTWTTPGFTSISQSRGGGVSVSPDNTKIALAGTDNGQIYVFDYNAAAGTVSNPRQSTTGPVLSSVFPSSSSATKTHGTAWLDNSTILIGTSDGKLITVNAANPNLSTEVGTIDFALPPPGVVSSEFCSTIYNPAISPNVYVSYSGFGGWNSLPNSSQNRVVVMAPPSTPGGQWTQIKRITLNTADTLRTLAFDSTGNLFFSVFGGTTNPGAQIGYIAGGSNVANLNDEGFVYIYRARDNATPISSSFNGIDIATGAVPQVCYANCDASTVAPVLNAGDFSCFLSQFRAAGSLAAAQQISAYANCDASTVAPVLNAGDFSCFLSKFRAGCP